MNKLYCIILLAFMGISCNKEDLSTNNKLVIIGHGGMGYTSQYPINSLESILSAIALGADGVEIDVQMTSDLQLVAYHNKEMQENTNKSGYINDHTWAQLQNAKYTDLPYASYRIWRFEDIISAIPNVEDKYLFIDTKLFTRNGDQLFDKNFSDILLGIVEQFNLKEKFIIETSNVDMINYLHSQNSNLVIYYYVNSPEEALKIPNNAIISGVMFRQEKYSKQDIQQLHHKGLKTSAWSIINKADIKTAQDKEIDFVQVDNLRKILKLFK